jgi:hypothetical protein
MHKRWAMKVGDKKWSTKTTVVGKRSRAARRGTTVPLRVLASMTPEQAKKYVDQHQRDEA